MIADAQAANALPQPNPDLQSQTDVDPNLEWCFPGHAHMHHCMEQVIATRKKADAHPDGKDSPAAAKLRKVADELETKKHKRVLCRQHHYVDWRGQRRLLYVLWHRGGHQTDVWHTHDKKQWSEQDAKDFHAERMAHPGWSEPKPTLHEFEKRARVKHIMPPLISGGN